MGFIEIHPTSEWERRLSNLGEKLSPQERKAAQYAVHNKKKLRDMTIKQIADAAEVSEATVVRFCHRLGYDGLKGLKIAMAADHFAPEILNISDRNIPESMRVLRDTIHRYIVCLQDTVMLDNTEAFERAISAIMRAPKIDLYGVGGSISSMSFLRHMLIKVGVRVNECVSAHTWQLSAASLNADDLVILISDKGEAGELLQIIPKIRKKGTTVICITTRKFSPIARMSDIVLLAAGGTTINTVSALRVGINAMLEALCHAIAQRIEVKNADAV
jgi:DNA-binding MurR/RpiR family transcriptional regulator